jgi:hypothetical protein
MPGSILCGRFSVVYTSVSQTVGRVVSSVLLLSLVLPLYVCLFLVLV